MKNVPDKFVYHSFTQEKLWEYFKDHVLIETEDKLIFVHKNFVYMFS